MGGDGCDNTRCSLKTNMKVTLFRLLRLLSLQKGYNEGST